MPTGLSNVVDIAAGYDHSVALKSDGTVVTWGATNTYGRNLIPAGADQRRRDRLRLLQQPGGAGRRDAAD